MNDRQRETVEWLRKQILLHDSHGDVDCCEYKKFTVNTEWSSFVAVSTVVGRKGDSGTMASVYARTRRNIAVGPRGGLQLLNTARYDRKTQKMVHTKTHATGRSVVWALTD